MTILGVAYVPRLINSKYEKIKKKRMKKNFERYHLRSLFLRTTSSESSQ